MREKHELEKGVICESCLEIARKEEGYTRIRFERPLPKDTTGVTKTISRMNLCNNCYMEFKKIIETFIGRKFEEISDVKVQKEELKKLRDSLKSQTNEDEITLKK